MNRVKILGELDGQDMELLTPLFEPFFCRAGRTIVQQGAPADYLYLVIEGKAEVSYKPYDGTIITVSHVEKDGLFGWSAVIGSDIYTSSVIAIEDLEAFRVRGRDLRRLCKEHPDQGRVILERLASAVSSRWKNANDQVKSILMQGMEK